MRNPIKDKIASLIINDFPQLALMISGSARHNFDVTTQIDRIDIAEKNTNREIRIARSVGAYLPDMVRYFDYYFGSAKAVTVKKKGQTKQVVDFSTPRFHEIIGFSDFPIMCPSMTEPYVTAQQYVDFAELREGDTVLDLGGYSGLTSIAFSKRVGALGKVIVLEPDPVNFRAAQINFDFHRRINGIDNIVLLPVAISGQRGTIKFSAEGSMGSADTSIIGDFRGAVVEVEAVTLQDLVNRYGLSSVQFIKMDIEGAEEGVIAASTEFFTRYYPKIIIEPHKVNGVTSEGALKGLLGKLGYECASIDQVGLTLPLVTAKRSSIAH